MTIPPKCEDLYLKIAELERRETALLGKLDEWLAHSVKVSGENTALQKRLTVAEQLLQRVIDSSVLSFEQDAPEELESLEADICGALKPAADVPGST